MILITVFKTCEQRERKAVGFSSVWNLSLDKLVSLFTSTFSSRLLQFEARNNGQNIILWKFDKWMNCKVIGLKQWNLAIQSGVNTFVVFFYKFASRPKIFYLIKY